MQRHGRELWRQSENDMDVTRGEKFAAPCGEPPFPSARLTLWTVAIATTCRRWWHAVHSGCTHRHGRQCDGATASNGQQDFDVRLAFNRIEVLLYRAQLESRQLARGTINLRLGAVRRLAYKAADCGLLSADLAAGIQRVKP